MRIVAVEPILLRGQQGYGASAGGEEASDNGDWQLVVRVATDEGLVGWADVETLAPAAVACDGLGALDASQRGAIYFLARPILWVATMLVALATVAAGLAILRVFGSAMTALPAAMVDLGAGGTAPMHWLSPSPGRWSVPTDGRSALVWLWVLLASFALTGASLSLVAGALTRAYLALREICDGQPVDAAWPYEVPLDVSEAPRAPAA